jgi:hypothetical protein
MKSVKKKYEHTQKKNWPKIKLRVKLFFLKNQVNVGLKFNFSINFNILSFKMVIGN